MDSSGDAVLTQLRKGVLEYCVLACLRQRPAYGLELATQLTKGRLLTSEGTLYPLLSRLRKQGLVESTWQESTSGPPRRYYQLTDQGITALAAFAQTWRPFADDVSAILEDTP
jgi:PadR family transcriptional regulator, regulatory protein PadR